MNPYRRFLLLLLSFILLLGCLWGCGSSATQDAGDGAAASPAGQGHSAQTLVSDTISYSNGSTTLHFTCDEQGHWHWRDDPAFPLDQRYILSLLDTIKAMTAAQPIADAAAAADYGLDTTGKYLSTTEKNGQTITFYFGSTAESGAYYMTRSDLPESIFEAPTALTQQLNRGIFDMMLLPELPQIPEEKVRSISVQGAGETAFLLEKQEDGTWHSGDAVVSDQIPQLLLSELSSTAIQSAVDYRPSSGVTALCGLDTPAATVSVYYENTVGVESALTLTVGGIRGEGRYVLLNEDTTIYLLPAAQLTQLLTLAEQGL